MADYSLAQDKNSALGLNTRLRPDQLPPGKSVVSDNVTYHLMTRKSRTGYAPVLTGAKDAVLKGGPTGSSIYVKGHRPNLVSENERSTVATAGLYRPFNYNERHGLIICPEGDHTNLRLDAQAGTTDWAIDFTLWSDTFNPSIYNRDLNTSYWRPIIVACKGAGVVNQWAIRIIMDGADITAEPKFKVVLTLYEDADATYASTPTHTKAQDFFYDDGGGNKGWFVVGKRMWFGFAYDEDDGATGTITPYYKVEGGSIVSSAAIAIDAGGTSLRTNGTTHPTFDNTVPVVIGKRHVLQKHAAGTNHGIAEEGWNGVLGEFRLWGATQPTWASWAYTESEIPDSELDDSGGTVSGDNDLELYYSFADQYRQEATNLSKVDPRYTTGTVANNEAFLTGGDATWVTGASKLGSYALQIAPDFGYPDASFYNAVDDRGWYHTSAPGIRIPGGSAYLEKVTGASAAGQFQVPEEMSILITFEISTDGTSAQRMYLLHQAYVDATIDVPGPPANADEYEVLDLVSVYLRHDGASWLLETEISGGPGTPATSSALSLDTEYSAVITFQWEDSSGVGERCRIRQYIDGTLNGTASGSGGPRTNPLSDDSTSDDSTGGDNKNSSDQRRQVFPMSIGYRNFDVAPYDGGALGTPRGYLLGMPLEVGAQGGKTEWAFHVDDTPYLTSNGGCPHHFQVLFGKIGSVAIWHKILTQPEIDRFVDRGPNPAEIAAYGAALRSYWDMEEGQGNILNDRAYLGNNLRVNPYPEAKSVAGPVHRRKKSIITGFWENRPKTPREKARGREIYAIAGGSVCRMAKDGSGDPYFEPISNIVNMQLRPTPMAFSFSDFLYICNGVGRPLRVSRGRVAHAGVSPVFGEGVQGDNLGYLEHDRDGTFQIRQGVNTAGDPAFAIGRKYRWAITYYDPEAAVEGPPSRLMVWQVEGGSDLDSMILDHLPRSHDPHATVIRIYRSRANGSELFLVDEIPATQDTYTDRKKDTQLEFALSTFDNFPPPQGARFAIRLGGRVIYSGVDAEGATIYPTKIGNPEACPPQYQITVSEGRSARVTGMLSMHDRGLVFLQDTAFSVSDQGGDSGTSSLVSIPVSLQKIKDSTGCVEHNTIVTVDDLGAIFAGERGLYVTDGFNFRYVSDDIEPTWQTLNKSSYSNWIAVHWRKNDQYLMACRRASGTGRNDTVLVWDYARNAFSLFQGLEVKYWQVVEDENTGQNRLYFADYLGQMWEWDSEDSPVHNDGASRTGFTTLTGTVKAGSTATNVNLFSSSTLPTTADGLIGVELMIGSQKRRITWNDGTAVEVETAFSPAPVTGTAWTLGGITCKDQSGFQSLGSETTWKRVVYSQFNFEPQSGSVDLSVGYENNATPTKSSGVDASKDFKRVPALGRGRKIQWTIESSGVNTPWEVTDIETRWLPRGEAAWLV